MKTQTKSPISLSLSMKILGSISKLSLSTKVSKLKVKVEVTEGEFQVEVEVIESIRKSWLSFVFGFSKSIRKSWLSFVFGAEKSGFELSLCRVNGFVGILFKFGWELCSLLLVCMRDWAGFVRPFLAQPFHVPTQWVNLVPTRKKVTQTKPSKQS